MQAGMSLFFWARSAGKEKILINGSVKLPPTQFVAVLEKQQLSQVELSWERRMLQDKIFSSPIFHGNDLEELRKILKVHSWKLSVSVECDKFHNNLRHKKKLQLCVVEGKLTEYCSFGNVLEGMLLYKLVYGINKERIQRMIVGSGEFNLVKNFEITKSNGNINEKLQDMWVILRDNQTALVNKIWSQLEGTCSPESCFHVEELILHQVVSIKWPNVASAWIYKAGPENAMVHFQTQGANPTKAKDEQEGKV